MFDSGRAMKKFDIIIVGAGPGGLAAAYEAACRGLSVALIERRSKLSPITRACSEGLLVDEEYYGDSVSLSSDDGYIRFKNSDIVWDLKKGSHDHFDTSVKKPIMVFERFCMPYAGYDAIDVIAEVADILILVDDLSITGEKASFDRIYERIGSQFLVFEEAKKRLEKHFSFIHVCDREIIDLVNSPVTSFTLAIK
jgi:hypothetical protein